MNMPNTSWPARSPRFPRPQSPQGGGCGGGCGGSCGVGPDVQQLGAHLSAQVSALADTLAHGVGAITDGCAEVIRTVPQVALASASDALAGLGGTYGASAGQGRPLADLLRAMGFEAGDYAIQANAPWTITCELDANTVSNDFEFEVPNLFIPRSVTTDALPRTMWINEFKIDETSYVSSRIRAEYYATDELQRGMDTGLVFTNIKLKLSLTRRVPGPVSAEFTFSGEKLKLADPIFNAWRSGMPLAQCKAAARSTCR